MGMAKVQFLCYNLVTYLFVLFLEKQMFLNNLSKQNKNVKE